MDLYCRMRIQDMQLASKNQEYFSGFSGGERKRNEILQLAAKDKLEKSMVADDVSGQSIESEVRTSSGMFLEKALVYK
ncbi:hypothetical protein ES319_A11G324500v1 [Gossypium barbadense]|uniref:ABC transporter domain-containing protein n=2 Tax=Gossypium TaxID=3633 RepID=A0A5J5TUV5_GOSBA|nr:hypothetical protein ES319_A11G324500v1 [Gossypium barbadense]TYG96488.1 hypothetical protein ES288_A11G354400v1 [Gossypium darwinii]